MTHQDGTNQPAETEMGTIELKYDPTSGTFIVQNSNRNLGKVGAGNAVAQFLQTHRKHLGKMPDRSGMGMDYWIEAARVGKFKIYARSKGFEVVGPGPL